MRGIESDQNTESLLARTHRVAHRGSLPCPSVVIVARCLRISSLFFIGLALTVMVIAMSPWGAGELEHGRWLIVCCPLLIPFIAVWLIAWGINRGYLWAWFAALLVFTVYSLTVVTIFFVETPFTLILFPFGIIGLAYLFTHDCRKEFGLSRQ